MNKKPQGTEPFNAPVTEVVVEPVAVSAPAPTPQWQPRPKTIERQGGRTEPHTRRLPQIRGGICEWCGVLDKNVPSQFQYQLCPHFRGLGEMQCSYCDEAKNPTDVIIHSILNVAEHPDNPDKLVVWCNSYECSGKHIARFRVNN